MMKSLTPPLYKMLGFVLLGLAGLGFLLPVLPGTPFLLAAAWCFARSSEKWHQRLLKSELFGPIINNWEENHCISRSTKFVALSSMLVVGGASIAFGVTSTWLRAIAVVMIVVGSTVVLMTKTCDSKECECDGGPT